MIDTVALKGIEERRQKAARLIEEFPSKWTWPRFSDVNWAGRQPPLLYEALKSAGEDITALLGLVNEMVDRSVRLEKATRAVMGLRTPVRPPVRGVDPRVGEAIWALREVRALIRRLGRELK